MPEHACCGQAMVYPYSSIQGIVEWLDENRESNTGKFQDDLVEIYADEDMEGRLRWALTPSLVQHIGEKSSKVTVDGGWGKGSRTDPRVRLWNYRFEREGERIVRDANHG